MWFRLARSKKGETKFNISGERSDEKVDILYVCTKSKHIAYYLKHHDNRDGIDWIKLINEYPDLATHDNNFKGWLQNLHDINILEANSERLWGQKIFKYLVTPAKHLDTCGIMLGCVRSDSSNSLAIGEISIKLPNLTERSIIESLLQIGQLYYDNIYNVVSLKRADGQVIQWIGSLSDNLCFSANSLVFGKFLENDTISELSIE